MRQFDALVKRLNFKKEHENWNTARLLAAIYDASGSKKKTGGRFVPDDFMPRDPEPRISPWKHQLQMAVWLNAVFKGKDLRKNK